MSRRFCFLWFLAACSFLQPVQAQLPTARLDGVFPAGAAPGASVEVTITGNDLDDVDRLVFSHDGISMTRKMAEVTPFDEGPQPIENVFLRDGRSGSSFGHVIAAADDQSGGIRVATVLLFDAKRSPGSRSPAGPRSRPRGGRN
jgi:hypothetical protein